MSVYTQASNGKRFPTSGVDISTGVYSHQIPLLTITALDNDCNKVKREFSLNYSTSSSKIVGSSTPFGLGWTMDGESSFNDKTLNLSDGRVFHFTSYGADGKMQFADRKTLDFEAVLQDNTDLVIFYKDGVVEVMWTTDGGSSYTLAKIIFPNGETYDVHHGIIGDSTPISKITDADGINMMLVTFDNLIMTEIEIWQGWTKAVRSFKINPTSTYSQLISYSQLAPSSEDAKNNNVTFTYENCSGTANNYMVVIAVDSKEGFSETIKYDDNGHAMNGDSGTLFLPRVLKYTSDPGVGRAAFEQKFTYPEEHNFLGYPNNYTYSGNQIDNLYKYGGPEAYSYFVTVNSSDGEGSPEMFTTSTYNTYHLLTSQRTVSQDCVQDTCYSYPFDSNVDTNYENQPANIMNPISVEKKFYKIDACGDAVGKTMSYTVVYEYDDYGNQTFVKQPSGIEENMLYYDIIGDSVNGNCPPDPFNFFKRFLQSHTKTGTDGSKKVKEFTYTQYDPLQADDVGLYLPYVVKPLGMVFGDGAANAFSIGVSCQDTKEQKFIHNHISQVTFSMAGPENSTITTTCDIATSVEGNSITTSKTVTGYDGNAYSYTKISTVYTGLVTSITDRYDVEQNAEYLATGDACSVTNNVGSEYEEKITYTYCDYDSDYGGPTVVQEDPSGTKRIIVFNGKGDIVKSGRTMRAPLTDAGVVDNSKIYITMLQTYDENGKISSRTETDFKQDGTNMYSTSTITSYDGWGMQYEDKSDDNVIVRNVNNPLNLTSRKTTVAVDEDGADTNYLAAVETTYSLSKKPLSISKYRVADPDTPISWTLSYTGLDLHQSLTSPCGQNVTLDSFDVLDRVRTFKDSLGRKFSLDYTQGSPKNEVEKLSRVISDNDTTTLGEQTFDGIGRIISRTVSGRTTSAEYTGGMIVPTTVTTQSGANINFTFNQFLSTFPDSIEECDSTGAVQASHTFSYGKNDSTGSCGKLLEASNITSKLSSTYTTDGQMIHQLQDVGNLVESAGAVITECSLLGKTLAQTLKAPSGDISVSYTYDEYGRVDSKTQGGTKVQMGYDKFGRLVDETVMTSDDTVMQLTEVELDDLSREVKRTITETVSGGSTVLVIELGYDNDDKITSKTTTTNNTLMLDEIFAYDGANRLISHTIAPGYEPNSLPVASFNMKFTAQTFTYNDEDNILEIESTLESSGTNKSTFNYDTESSSKLNSISNSSDEFPGEIFFSYDGDGNVTEVKTDEKTLSMEYTPAGRLASYSSGSIQQKFQYDALQRLVNNGSCTRLYADGQVFAEKNESDTVEFMRVGTHVVSERTSSETLYVGNDNMLSAVASNDSFTVQEASYSPFGAGKTPVTRTGYAGEISVGGLTPPVYPLGNGTRVYFPELQMFLSPDGFVPFSGGGIHTYLYCHGNPLNMMDPTGHKGFFRKIFHDVVTLIVDVVVVAVEVASVVATGGASIPAVLAITAGVFAVTADTLGLAADSLTAEDSNKGTDHSQTINNLSIASHAFGTASTVVGMGEPAAGRKGDTKSRQERYKKSADDKHSHSNKMGSNATNENDKNSAAAMQKKADKYDSKAAKLTNDETGQLITGGTMGRNMLATSIGLNMDSVRKAGDKGLPIHKRVMHGAWATVGVSSTLRGYGSSISYYSSLSGDTSGSGADGSDPAAVDDGSMTAVNDSITNGYPMMEG